MIEPSEEVRFMANVLDLTALVHELTTKCWNAGKKDISPQMISLGGNYLKDLDKTKLIRTFINHSHDYWEKIRLHEEIFFIENAHVVFQQLPIDSKNINAFKLFFTATDKDGKDIIPKGDRDAIWEIFESLVKICIKYVHRVRGVKTVVTENGPRSAYANKDFPKVKVQELAKLWKIDLPTS